MTTMGMTKLLWERAELIDARNGQKIGLINAKSISEVTWYSKDASPIEIGNSYCFQCEVKLDSAELLKAFQESPQYRTANALCDRLNDLIEEYHAPGVIRRERRAIKREFNRMFQIFQGHCLKHMINIKFTRS